MKNDGGRRKSGGKRSNNLKSGELDAVAVAGSCGVVGSFGGVESGVFA